MEWILPNKTSNDPVGILLESRNIKDTEKFFNPTTADLYDPFELYGTKDAAKSIIEAVKQEKKIFIHGDFDVDGITSTTVLWKFLFNELKADALPYIPSRFDEGYGLSDDSIQNIISQGGNLIITVDCGIKDINIINKYKDQIDFIITDHHTLLSSELENDYIDSLKINDFIVAKNALAVVHPRLNPDYPLKDICGANVSWKLCWAIHKLMDLKSDIFKYLDLVALGTVCDIMPLVDENRTIVKLGIDRMRTTPNEGIKALCEVSGIAQKDIQTYHFGYIIGPRLNASGRIGHALDAVRLLSTESKSKAMELALKINSLNSERQELTQKYFGLATEQIIKKGDQKAYFIVGEDWPEGILGLIAGKLAQKIYRPVLVASTNGSEIRGSARSISGINITEVLKSLNHRLSRFGGHAQAAGFQLIGNSYSEFNREFTELIDGLIKEEDLIRKLKIDAVLANNDMDIELIENINRLEPFGQQNEQPLFASLANRITNIAFVGNDKSHIKFIFQSKNGPYINAIGFNKAKDLSKLLSSAPDKLFDIAGKLNADSWNGNNKVQFMVEDVRESNKF